MPQQEQDRARADEQQKTAIASISAPEESAADLDDVRAVESFDAAAADSLSTRGGGIAPPSRPPARSSGPAPVPEDKRRDEAPREKKPGLVDFARRLLKDFVQGEEADKPKPNAPDAGAPIAAPAAAPRRLNGKVRRQGKRLIIELDVTSVLTWSPAGEARVELSDGTIIKAPVLIAMTTAAGEYGLGLTITLVLELDERVAEPATVHLSNGGEVLEIVL